METFTAQLADAYDTLTTLSNVLTLEDRGIRTAYPQRLISEIEPAVIRRTLDMLENVIGAAHLAATAPPAGGFPTLSPIAIVPLEVTR